MKVFSLNLYDYFGLAHPEGAEGELFCYLPDTSREVNPARRHPAILVLPGGGYAFTSDREAEPVALQFLARGYSAFVLRYSVAPACTAFLVSVIVTHWNWLILILKVSSSHTLRA